MAILDDALPNHVILVDLGGRSDGFVEGAAGAHRSGALRLTVGSPRYRCCSIRCDQAKFFPGFDATLRHGTHATKRRGAPLPP